MRTIEEVANEIVQIRCWIDDKEHLCVDIDSTSRILHAYALEIVERCDMIGTAAVREEIER